MFFFQSTVFEGVLLFEPKSFWTSSASVFSGLCQSHLLHLIKTGLSPGHDIYLGPAREIKVAHCKALESSHHFLVGWKRQKTKRPWLALCSPKAQRPTCDFSKGPPCATAHTSHAAVLLSQYLSDNHHLPVRCFLLLPKNIASSSSFSSSKTKQTPLHSFLPQKHTPKPPQAKIDFSIPNQPLHRLTRGGLWRDPPRADVHWAKSLLQRPQWPGLGCRAGWPFLLF